MPEGLVGLEIGRVFQQVVGADVHGRSVLSRHVSMSIVLDFIHVAEYVLLRDSIR